MKTGVIRRTGKPCNLYEVGDIVRDSSGTCGVVELVQTCAALPSWQMLGVKVPGVGRGWIDNHNAIFVGRRGAI